MLKCVDDVFRKLNKLDPCSVLHDTARDASECLLAEIYGALKLPKEGLKRESHEYLMRHFNARE
jgi:hypothetical protein